MKRYCYVDESGQDTRGRLFVVALVFTGTDREGVTRSLEGLEAASGKEARKWQKTRPARRSAYLHGLQAANLFGLRAYYAVDRGTRDYRGTTIDAVTRAVQAEAQDGDEVHVLVDALRRSERHGFGGALRERLPGGLWLRIRGVRNEEADPFARLADALAGVMRAAEDGQVEAREFRDKGIAKGWLRALP